MEEMSYVMVKPEFANDENVINFIKDRLLSAGLTIVDESYIKYDKKRAAEHYHEHVGKSFYGELEEYITSDKAYGMVVVGENAIAKIRELVGPTKINDEVIANNPCVVNTIRYIVPEKLGLERRITQNVVHASDAVESAKKEILIFAELKREADKIKAEREKK